MTVPRMQEVKVQLSLSSKGVQKFANVCAWPQCTECDCFLVRIFLNPNFDCQVWGAALTPGLALTQVYTVVPNLMNPDLHIFGTYLIIFYSTPKVPTILTFLQYVPRSHTLFLQSFILVRFIGAIISHSVPNCPTPSNFVHALLLMCPRSPQSIKARAPMVGCLVLHWHLGLMFWSGLAAITALL